ncbi:MAG: hypothetical protein ACYS17_07490, partial [Planctomycetota bacterium]
MRSYHVVIIVAAIFVGFVLHQQTIGAAPETKAKRELRDIIGVTHVDGKYHLTDKDFLNEGAEQILSLGSRVIKVWFHNPRKSYSFNSQWPKMNSLVEIAQTKYFRKLFDKPFTTYIMMCFSFGNNAAYWRNGIT